MHLAEAYGFILRTGYSDKRAWYLLPIREGLDNCLDFLWKHYRGENVSVNVEIVKNDKLFHIKIRNSNHKNIPVFQDLYAIFNYDTRYGSKQDVHIISRGMLGDATKQILSLGYVLTHANDKGTEFDDKQWQYPLIIRHNKKESKISLSYNKAKQEYRVELEQSLGNLTFIDTEIELVLPIIDEVRNTLDRSYIERFCRVYSILTTDVSFTFRILDDSTLPQAQPPESDGNPLSNANKSASLFRQFVTTLSKPPPKGILDIKIPALHPVAMWKEWNNADSIHSYLPEEFTTRITNVHHKNTTMVHDILLTFREGTNVKKTAKSEKSVAELVSDPNMYREIEEHYDKLKSALPPQKKLSLPYTTNRKERVNGLIPRVAELYDIDKSKKPSYRIEWGYHDDGNVRYPYAFEILGIPLANPVEDTTEFIGAVNYSFSPNNIKLEGEYYTGGLYIEKNIDEVLRSFGFHKHSAKKSRLPCIVIGNLITPRRDPHGYDKSRLDTKPFAETIVTAVKK